MFQKPLSLMRVAFFALIFLLVFSAYYRFFELFTNLPFGKRAPDVLIFGLTFSSNLAKAMIWGSVHYLAYFIPSYIILKVKP